MIICCLDNNFHLEDYINLLKHFSNENENNKKISDYDNFLKNNNKKNSIDKNSIIHIAFLETYKKYGYEQLSVAINRAINENFYGHFTNGDSNYREQLIKYVTKKDIVSYINSYIKNNSFSFRGNNLLEQFMQCFINNYDINNEKISGKVR